MRLSFWPLLIALLPTLPFAQPVASNDFISLANTATSLGKPYFVFAFANSSQAADSIEQSVSKQPFIHDFIKDNFLSRYIGPQALNDGYAGFRQLYKIEQNSLLVFDPWGKIIARHTDITNTGDLYRSLFWDLQQMQANPNPVTDATFWPPYHKISVPVPHPLEAEAGYDLAETPSSAPPPYAPLPTTRSESANSGDDVSALPPTNKYVVLNANLPGLKAYHPEIKESQFITVVMGLYPSQPRLVAALQQIRTQTSLPCYTFLASDEAGTPFYTLAVGRFSDANQAWQQVLQALPANIPVCVGVLSTP